MSNIDPKAVGQLIADAGGEIIGKTRLQKVAYILEAAGLGCGFKFAYHHYGPFSEDLSNSSDFAAMIGLVIEESQIASWGGRYSIFKTSIAKSDQVDQREPLLNLMVKANAVQLELAATAVFIASTDEEDVWSKVSVLKSDKSTDLNLNAAKELCQKLANIVTPIRLPLLAN